MSKGKKRYRRGSYKGPVREYVDSYYKESTPRDAEGNTVESLKLSDEEKQFMYDFEDEYYGNNHRTGKLHKNHPDYEDFYKKDLDHAANCRMRDVLAMNRYDKRIIRDLTNVANPDYSNSGLLDKLKKKGFESTVLSLISDALLDLDVEDKILGKDVLSNLSIDIVRVIKAQQASDRAARSKK